MPSFARAQVNFRKAFQFLGGTSNVCMLIADVDLCNLVPLTLPRVGNIEGHSNVASSPPNREITISKSCIGKAIAEGKQRLYLIVFIASISDKQPFPVHHLVG